MSKGTFFTGQPIFSQVLDFIPRSMVIKIARELKADHYCKCFKTYDHLVSMLYGILNQCTSLREVTTGLLAWEQRILHLGINAHPRRSTLSDANARRSHEVFEKIYLGLLSRYQRVLPDSRKRCSKKNLYIFDSTTIALFQEILKAAGPSKASGRRKGGIKVHTLLKSHQDLPCMVRYSAGAAADSQFLKQVQLPKGSVIVFDRGYREYTTYKRFTCDGITWITRHRDQSVFTVIQTNAVSEYQSRHGVQKDEVIELGHKGKKATRVAARMIYYKDPATGKNFQFITNNQKFSSLSIANYYQKRWQIETFFKRIKQNYPLQYFLGDNENAIKIQIWCALIADLLLKVIRRGTKASMSFSAVVSLVRIHLMTYMGLTAFLNAPEKSLLRRAKQQKQQIITPLLFSP